LVLSVHLFLSNCVRHPSAQFAEQIGQRRAAGLGSLAGSLFNRRQRFWPNDLRVGGFDQNPVAQPSINRKLSGSLLRCGLHRDRLRGFEATNGTGGKRSSPNRRSSIF